MYSTKYKLPLYGSKKFLLYDFAVVFAKVVCPTISEISLMLLLFIETICLSILLHLHKYEYLIVIIKSVLYNVEAPSSWSNSYAFCLGARGLRFKCRAGRIEHIVANRSPPLRHFFEKSCVAAGAMTRIWAQHTRYKLRHNTASITKDLILITKSS